MKDLLGYIPFRIAAGIFGLFPEPWVRWIGERGGDWAAGRKSARYPLLESHMRRVLGPDASDETVHEAVRGMYRSYGRYWAETFWFRPRRRQFIIDGIDRVNFEPVEDAIAEGRPRIFALPHIGNWEVAGVIAEQIGTPVVAVAEHLPNQMITDWFIDVRNGFGIEIILTSDSNRTRKLIRILKEGGAIALVADRDVTGRGIEADFFGEPAQMPAGPVALAALTGADLFPVGAYFKEGAGHRIVVHDRVDVPQAETREERIALGVQHFARELEDIIREAPDQWHLFQPNWPTDADLVEDDE
ncbi:MAG: phosphatidylinositol mannoside acyltransferase [Acidimicrobiia bacterium]